jgi:hypothetical protein
VVIKVLAADSGAAMGVRIVPPAEDSGVRDIVWKEVAEPVGSIRVRPGLVLVSVQAMDGDDAEGNVRISRAARETSSLDDGIDPFCHNLQTLRARLLRGCRVFLRRKQHLYPYCTTHND